MQTPHKIAPDVPVFLIEKFDSYDWNKVSQKQIETMMQYLSSVIVLLPEKQAGWSFTGKIPTITLWKNCAIPQLAFDWLNTRDWAKIDNSMLRIIVNEAETYFVKMGVPKRS